VPRNYLSSSAPEHSLHSLVEKWTQPAEKSHYRCLRGAAIPTGSRIQYWRARALLCPRAHHLLPLALTNVRRADNFCAPNKVTGHCHCHHYYRTLTLVRHPTRLSRSTALRITATWGRNIQRRALSQLSFETACAATAAAGTHARRRNSLARSPARIDPQLLSSQTRHPRKAGRPKPKFLRLSLPACASSLSLHTLPSALLSRLTPHGRLHFPPTFAHRSHGLPHALEPT
jgi:hypothetical protein